MELTKRAQGHAKIAQILYIATLIDVFEFLDCRQTLLGTFTDKLGTL